MPYPGYCCRCLEKRVQNSNRIVDEVFPTHAPREPDEAIEIGKIPKISEAEVNLRDALKRGKAPGPDGIPADALKAAADLPAAAAGYVQRVPEAGPLLQAVESSASRTHQQGEG